MSSRRVVRGLLASALLLGLVLVSAPVPAVVASPSVSPTVTVSVKNYAFTSSAVTVAQGKSVGWVFHSMHTTTSNQGFWDSGMRSSGTYVVAFNNAGTFSYHCTMHASMTGHVTVPLRHAGSATHGWTVTWSSATGTSSKIRFDVQYRKVGTSAWSTFRTKTAARSALFNPSRSASYQVHARTRLGAKVSGWTPVLTVKIS
jgi:plastocyanin